MGGRAIEQVECKLKRRWVYEDNEGYLIIMEIWCKILKSWIIRNLWSANGYIIINKCNYCFACKMYTKNKMEESILSVQQFET